MPKPTDDLVEALAEIEHEQWLYWSKTVASKVLSDAPDNWRQSWVNHPELTENLKEADRVWARKVVARPRERRLIE